MYLGHDLDLSGSRDVIGHVTIRFPTPHFLLVLHWYWHSISRGFWHIEAQMYLGHSLTFLGHVTSSITWPFDSTHTTSYWYSIGTNALSPRDFEILRLKCIWVKILTFLGHVTSSVTWSFFPRYVVSYGWSVDTSFLTGKVTEIFGCKGPINAISSQACIFPV